MLNTSERLAREIELQEELLLQYEAIVEEMQTVHGRARHNCIHRASELLRKLSSHTRRTASELRHAG